MGAAYYNEIDPYCAQWLRNLIAAGHIAAGDVDERDIRDVRPDDLRRYTQCHFFAGIGVWSYALRLAGWPDNRPVWTGSCPCQPFSQAGQGAGFDDERHLWPAWHHLIEQCKPRGVFGEQVASPDGYEWLDLVQADLEATGYSCGPVVLPAAGFSAPHGRHRIWFVADTSGKGLEKRKRDGRIQREEVQSQPRETVERSSSPGPLEHAQGEQVGIPGRPRQQREAHWTACDWIPCVDGKLRPVEPGTFPLAHGAPTRVGRLRAYGNAIVAEVAAQFIAAARQTIDA